MKKRVLLILGVILVFLVGGLVGFGAGSWVYGKKSVDKKRYNALVDDYNKLLDKDNKLVGDYNNLLDEYKKLVDKNNKLREDYLKFMADIARGR